jgi:3-hydroxyisobutyrate dehydrogenase-like beta-hydroxyacid dehydrogenase
VSALYCYVSGIAKRQATWMLGGEEEGRKLAGNLLGSLGNIVDMGDDVGAANVVKLCGNFLIAVRIVCRFVCE